MLKQRYSLFWNSSLGSSFSPLLRNSSLGSFSFPSLRNSSWGSSSCPLAMEALDSYWNSWLSSCRLLRTQYMINDKSLLRDKINFTIVHRSLKLMQLLKMQAYWEADWIFWHHWEKLSSQIEHLYPNILIRTLSKTCFYWETNIFEVLIWTWYHRFLMNK